MNYQVDEKGFYGEFGGAFIPEMLYPNIEELRLNYLKITAEPSFKKEFMELLVDYVGRPTPLYFAKRLSKKYNTKIYLKREDLQVVRSYKIRGAYNKISQLDVEKRELGIVCASAGNHAQGVDYSCCLLGIKVTIFMPATTPKQKVKQVELFGKSNVEIVLTGDTFDDAYEKALEFSQKERLPFIHPFDDEKVIAGQGTVGLEIIQQVKAKIDFLFIPIGGGGLAAGVSTVFKSLSPSTKIIGVEPKGAPSMSVSLKNGVNTTLDIIDKFVDGASVKRVGELNFAICKSNLDDVVLVAEGKACATILQLYNEEAMVVEPAGALSIAALDT
jgi:threonine dehydratase